MRHSGTLYDRVVSEMNSVPCVDRAFDLVVANAVFHHSEDLVETFAEMRRLLRPGGRMVCLEPIVGPLNLSGKAYMGRLHDDGLGDEAYAVWTYTRAAAKAGLRCRLWIAPSVGHHLRHLREDPEYAGNYSLKYRFARGAAGILQMPILGRVTQAVLYPAALYLFGLTCIFVAERRDGKQPHPQGSTAASQRAEEARRAA